MTQEAQERILADFAALDDDRQTQLAAQAAHLLEQQRDGGPVDRSRRLHIQRGQSWPCAQCDPA